MKKPDRAAPAQPIDERLEYPLPVLSLDCDALTLETRGHAEGRLRIKNAGGGVLNGHALCRAACVVFEPERWEGNDVALTYRFDPDASGLKPGDTLETACYICSNGGEKKLPVSVKLIKMAITTDEGGTIANIKDFYEYALAHPAKARRIFTDSEFYMLLLTTDYPYMEAYEILHRDTNRERALDHFFILSQLKQKTTLTLPSQPLAFTRKPYENAVIQGQFLPQKSDGGYVDAPVSKKNDAPWLTLSVHRLVTSDFNETHTAMVGFAIDPARVAGRYARETILVGEDAVDVVFKRSAPLSIRLDRETYRFDDEGRVEIVNHTGGELWAEVFCKDSFVRFGAKRYAVGENGEIPFTLRLSTFMSAQMRLRKLPYIKTLIEVKTVCQGKPVKAELALTAGKW